MPKRKFLIQKQTRKLSECHFSLSPSFFFFLGINYIYKLEHALGINELPVVKDEIGRICFTIGATSQSVSLYYKSANAVTVLRHCALRVFALCKYCSGNSALVRHFFFFFFLQSSVCIFFFLLYIYCYIDTTNFTIFSQLLRCQFLIS